MKNMRFWRTALVATLVLTVMLSVTGGTIAWFTDSVTSEVNTIKAGNLDMVLEYKKPGDSQWNTVDENTELFSNSTLWEPGHTEVVALRISNAGSLALKYDVKVKINSETSSTNVYGETFKLSDYLEVYNSAVQNGDNIGDILVNLLINSGRNGINVADMNKSDFDMGLVNDNPSTDLIKKLSAEEAVMTCLVITMPTTVGNEANHMTGVDAPSITFGIEAEATQYTEEPDSFDNQYDKDAPAWTGEADTSWYNEVDTEFTLTSAEDLAGLAELVNGGKTFSKKTIKLDSNLELGGKEWTPIGNSTYSFKGNFDGQGHTISNLKIDMGGKSNVGLFGMTTEGSVKNVHMENAAVSGRLNVGVIAGTPYTSEYENIRVTGDVKVEGMSYVGAVGGKNAYANWTNITIDVNEGSYVKANSVENGTAYRTYIGGVVGFMGEGSHKMTNVYSNIDVIGTTCDVGGIIGIAHYGNSFVNVVCEGDVTITNAAEAADAEEMGGIAGVWHNETGSTVTFENCKFTGTLSANITEGVDLSDNTIVGAAYSATGTGELIIK